MNETYRRLEQVETMEIDGETLLLNQDTLAVTKLNEAGGWIWSSMEEPATVDQLAARMTREYLADLQQVREDLKLFLNKMLEIGLVVRV